ALCAVIFVSISLAGVNARPNPDTIWNKRDAMNTEAFTAPIWANAKTYAWLLAGLMLGTLGLFW
ncbi:MAG: SSS family solute/sodium (Na+) symporter, partial [Pseudomonadota bacterium]